MWIFTNFAFISIVKDRTDPTQVVVRARVRDDLEKMFGSEHNVIESSDSDYRFRMFLDHEFVTKTVAERVEEIDYDNFKNSISLNDRDRYKNYTGVWSVMNSWQMALYGTKDWYSSYR